VLRRIFGSERVQVKWKWRKQHNEEFNYLYSSPNIIRVIKYRRMRLAVRVAHMGRGEGHIGFWWKNLREETTWNTQA
jgi:hypothetical protein